MSIMTFSAVPISTHPQLSYHRNADFLELNLQFVKAIENIIAI